MSTCYELSCAWESMEYTVYELRLWALKSHYSLYSPVFPNFCSDHIFYSMISGKIVT